MLTMHPTLLIGPSDWQPARMPQAEFDRRIDSLWQCFPSASRAVVCGMPHRHAELAYFTNLVPKLEAAVALLARGSTLQLFLGGGPNMLGAARPLTFVTELAPLRGGAAIGQAALEGHAGGDVLLIGAGAMPTSFRQSLVDALGPVPTTDATAQAVNLMRRKSAHEIAAVRESCALLDAAVAAIDEARRMGANATTAVLAGERAALARGAQDVRTLFSLDGGRTLAPFAGLQQARVDPLQVYVAVRHLNYWAEGFASLSRQPSPAKVAGMEVLGQALGAIKPGLRIDDVAALIVEAAGRDRLHPVTASAPIEPIGLELERSPDAGVAGTLETGEVISMRVGISDPKDGHAIVSAMVALREDDHEVLWISS